MNNQKNFLNFNIRKKVDYLIFDIQRYIDSTNKEIEDLQNQLKNF